MQAIELLYKLQKKRTVVKYVRNNLLITRD